MKTIKRILSVISTVTVCAVPILSTPIVNAASSDQYDTYAIYCDVPANSGVMWANLEFVYKDIEESFALCLLVLDGKPTPSLALEPTSSGFLHTYKTS